MPTNNSWNNAVSAENVSFTGGTFIVGNDATDNAISIGTAANAGRTLTIGNVTGTSAVNINTGTGGSAITTTNGTFGVITGTGAINIGADAVAKTVTVGNTTGASVLALKTGTGDCTLVSATGTLISALDTGEITLPLTPAFHAKNTVRQNDVTGNGTNYQMINNTEIFDQGNNYNNATGIFTAPVTGRYFFHMDNEVLGLTSSHTLGFMVFNISNADFYNFGMNWWAVGGAANDTTMAFTCFTDMDAADTCSPKISIANGAKVVDVNASGFGGYLVC
jgi:hypothetical protein